MFAGFLAGFYPLLIVLSMLLFRPIDALIYRIAAILWSIDPTVPGSVMIFGYIFSTVLPLGFNRGTKFDYAAGFLVGFVSMIVGSLFLPLSVIGYLLDIV